MACLLPPLKPIDHQRIHARGMRDWRHITTAITTVIIIVIITTIVVVNFIVIVLVTVLTAPSKSYPTSACLSCPPPEERIRLQPQLVQQLRRVGVDVGARGESAGGVGEAVGDAVHVDGSRPVVVWWSSGGRPTGPATVVVRSGYSPFCGACQL